MGKTEREMRSGLIGEHLGHSYSKMIHGHIAEYSYELVELPEEKVGDFVKNGGLDCFNVTIPYKKTVIPYLDTVSPEASRIGAVNTVVRRENGRLEGYNTDYFGFDATVSRLGVDIRGKKAVVLGSGGASVTVAAVLADRGAAEVITVGRRLDNNYENLYRHYDARLIVNATPVGMYPKNGEKPVSLADFTQLEGVIDLIYNPEKTALLLEAEKLGIPFINGLYMLSAQAVKAYELFTDTSADGSLAANVTDYIRGMTENIVLIGMAGCGKTTVGGRLAVLTGRKFADADEAFTVTYGITPAEAIETKGEDEFRNMETQVLSQLCRESGYVIACGGGVVTRERNRDIMAQNGIIVYVKRDISKLDTTGRPLSQRHSVQKLFEQRREAYERFADYSVENEKSPEETAEAIVEVIKGEAKNENTCYKRT